MANKFGKIVTVGGHHAQEGTVRHKMLMRREQESGAKHKALEKAKGGVDTKRLNHLRGELRKERISYGEIAELGNYKKHLIKSGDSELAEAAGISEREFNRGRNKKN